MIAVMGASGNVGSKVTELLLAQNQPVRVFGRSAERLETFRQRGAEVVTGNIKNLDDLQRLLAGAEAAMVLLPDDVTDPRFVANRSDMSRAITQAIRDRRVGHVVALSSVGADREDAPGPIAGLHELERRLFELEDVNVLVLRSAWRMENLLAALPLIQDQKINGSAIKGDLRFPMIASRDVAADAAQRLVRRDFTGHSIRTLLGPEDVSMNEATRALGAQIGLPQLPYVEFPPDGVKAGLLGAGMSDEVASLLVEGQIAISEGRLVDEFRRSPETTTPTTLEAFLKDALAR